MDNNGLTYITVGETTLGFKFGMQAILELDGVGDSVDGFQLKMAAITNIAWAGYKNWCFNKQQLPMSFEAFNEFLDDAFIENQGCFMQIIECFKNSKALKMLNEKAAQVADEKEVGAAKKKTKAPRKS